MFPDVLQLLTWVAARTKRIQVGSMVVVLPWHDPLRVAEQVAMLDTMSEGRLIQGRAGERRTGRTNDDGAVATRATTYTGRRRASGAPPEGAAGRPIGRFRSNRWFVESIKQKPLLPETLPNSLPSDDDERRAESNRGASQLFRSR